MLQREAPDVIFVQNPPIFAVLVASLYARRYGARYVIDSHTGAFRSAKWRWSTGLHRSLSTHALTTIVHNESQGDIVRTWPCSYSVIGFVPGEYPEGEAYPLLDAFNIAVVCGFEADEPVEAIFGAARHLPEVALYVTGDSRQMKRRLLKGIPKNIHLTGYMPYERYVGLLRNADAVMDLVDDEHTLLLGAFEAVSLGVPMILSDSPLLRKYFSAGAIHVVNTVEGICGGIRDMQHEVNRLREEIGFLRSELEAEWEQRRQELSGLLD
jgi:glycosyltransferase involved in cell wall biosynthesis